MNKKIISLLILTALALLFSATAVNAQATLDLTSKLGGVGSAGGFGTKSIAQSVGQIIRGLLTLLGVIFMCYIVYAGWLWMSASGKEEQIEKAKGILRGTVIGLIIVLAAYAITAFVMNSLITATQYSG